MVVSDETLVDMAAAPTYRSGVAARLAGVPVETLRVWERRYGVVGPRLSPRGQRLYTAEEVQRLALIKQLLDMGHPIGSIAKLPANALLAMRTAARDLAEPGRFAAGVMPRPARLVLIGPVIADHRFDVVGTTAPVDSLIIVGRCISAQDAAKVLQDVRADVVVIALPSLNDASLATVARIKSVCAATQAIVLYRFAPSAVIRRLREAGHEIARAPSEPIELESLCRALIRLPYAPSRDAAPLPQSPPSARFSERELLDLASASSTIYCECPRHLVELVISLSTFERYSADCASRDTEDAAVHRDLQLTAGYARALLEEALLRVAVTEGLSLPQPRTQS